MDQAKRLRGWGLQVDRWGVATTFPHKCKEIGVNNAIFMGVEGRGPCRKGRGPERVACAERGRQKGYVKSVKSLKG